MNVMLSVFEIQAREVGCAKRKWLMINVQNVSEFTCQILNRDVWSNSVLKEIVRDNFIFLQVIVNIVNQ